MSNINQSKDIQKEEIRHEKALIKEEKDFQKDILNHNKEFSKKEIEHQDREKKLLKELNKEERERLTRESELFNLERVRQEEFNRTQAMQSGRVYGIPRTEQQGELREEMVREQVHNRDQLINQGMVCEGEQQAAHLGGLNRPIFSVQHPLTIPSTQQQTTDYSQQSTGFISSGQSCDPQNVTEQQKPGFIANVKHGFEKMKEQHYEQKEIQSLEKAAEYGSKANEAAYKASQLPHT